MTFGAGESLRLVAGSLGEPDRLGLPGARATIRTEI